MGLMHIMVRQGWHDADYISRYAEGFDELQKRLPEYTPERVAQWTGIAKDDIERLAREYATTRPAAIRLNYGIQRSQNGGAAVRAVCMCRSSADRERNWWRTAALDQRRLSARPHCLERRDLMLKSPLGDRRARSTWCNWDGRLPSSTSSRQSAGGVQL